MSRHPVALALVLAACGSSSHSLPPDASPDAPRPIDAAPPPDMALDAPSPTGMHYHYVIDHVNVPTTSAQAQADGLDLDGNGTIDNQLGNVLATFTSQGFDFQTTVSQDVDDGAIIMLGDLQASALDNASDAGFTLYTGTNPQPPACSSPTDTVCRHHLTGSAMFDVAASPRDNPLAGAIVNGTYTTTTSGHLSVQLALAGNPVTLTLIGARAKLVPTATTITTGILAGAITTTDLDTKVFPAVQQAVTATIAADCTALTSPPTCGCASGSQGASLIALFDANHDCAVSVDEIENNQLIQALFAPDVTVEGQKALSFGVQVTAVGAVYTP
ncbi:MAG TPA: hypothetical protein VLX92_13885 [Kofleriaceae bacterium]|nr:hypothetical protein [Kofleriaceae bacterium]